MNTRRGCRIDSLTLEAQQLKSCRWVQSGRCGGDKEWHLCVRNRKVENGYEEQNNFQQLKEKHHSNKVQKVEEDLQILKPWSSNSAETIHISMFTPIPSI